MILVTRSKIVIVLIFAVFFLLKLKSSYAQRLLFIDDYNVKFNLGLRFQPKLKISNAIWLGGMGGVRFSSTTRRLGLNLRLNYMLPFFIQKDTLQTDYNPFYISYIELTYRVIKYKKIQTAISLGISKASDKINPYYGCPYCSAYDATFSIQLQIQQLSIEFRFDSFIGDNFGGWYFPRHVFSGFNLGINYTFSLSKKRETL